MIGWGGGSRLDQRGNMESLQRDGLARVKAVDAFRLLVRQNKKHVSVRSLDLPPTLIFNPPPQKKTTTTLYCF